MTSVIFRSRSSSTLSLEPALCNEKPPQEEACALQLESRPHLLQPEKSPHTAMKTSTAKNKLINTEYYFFYTAWVGAGGATHPTLPHPVEAQMEEASVSPHLQTQL